MLVLVKVFFLPSDGLNLCVFPYNLLKCNNMFIPVWMLGGFASDKDINVSPDFVSPSNCVQYIKALGTTMIIYGILFQLRN